MTDFYVLIRDGRAGRRWYTLISHQPEIDEAFEWLCENLAPSGDGWFSILHKQFDSVWLEVHILDESLYSKFEAKFSENYLAND